MPLWRGAPSKGHVRTGSTKALGVRWKYTLFSILGKLALGCAECGFKHLDS